MTALWQRPLPPGLRPWRIPALILFSCVVVVVLPAAAAIAVLLVVAASILAAIGSSRYRFIKSQDSYERPRNEALFKRGSDG